MAGFYDRLYFDPCHRQFEDYTNARTNSRQLNLAANYRTNLDQAHALSLGKNPDFYGPLRGRRTTQESFLQGRGQSLSDCPDCGVRWLPETLFPESGSTNARAQCQRTDLEPLYTRQPKSCNGLEETDVSAYWMMPSAYQTGYTGLKPVVTANTFGEMYENGYEAFYNQTRQSVRDLSVDNGGESYGACRTSYGSYGSGRDFSRYAL